MQIIITGGAGFLGQRLARALLNLNTTLPFTELLLADISLPPMPADDGRIRTVQADLSDPGAARTLVGERTDMVFHLAAVVSSHAEKDFDLGWRVNMESTRHLLEACRHARPGIRFIFASSLAVYGGDLPAVVDDRTAVTPQSSYGMQKAAAELLVNDYARKGFVDGRALRLPTVCVRPGRPNLAASSFVSSIIREPLSGQPAVCPVPDKLGLWLSSPDTVIRNLVHGARLDAASFGAWRTVNLPGIGLTVAEMLDSLRRATNNDTVAMVRFEHNPTIHRIVSSWPAAIDNSKALSMGFSVDTRFDDFIDQFRRSLNPLAG